MFLEYLNIVLYDLLKIAALVVPVLIAVAMIVWVDRRVWGAVQLRKGPNVVGPFGLFQTLADALKYIFKEVIIPIHANKVIFIIAPIVTMSLALIAWAVIPLAKLYLPIVILSEFSCCLTGKIDLSQVFPRQFQVGFYPGNPSLIKSSLLNP